MAGKMKLTAALERVLLLAKDQREDLDIELEDEMEEYEQTVSYDDDPMFADQNPGIILEQAEDKLAIQTVEAFLAHAMSREMAREVDRGIATTVQSNPS